MSDVASSWLDVETSIRRLVEAIRSFISEGTVDAVEHYLVHAEYEMALEGLLLDVMKACPSGGPVDWRLYETLARQLGLDVESTFDGEFWKKFTSYVAAHSA